MAPAVSSWRDLAESAVQQKEDKLGLAVTRPLGPTESELQNFCEWLSEDVTVAELHLRSNSLGDRGAFDLATALKENSGIERLFLSGNGISGEGALHLADALMENCTLEQLFLSVNQIGDYGAEQLAAALQANGTLQVLYLNNNDITNEGARHFKQALQANGSLEVLSLAGNKITDEALLKSITAKLDRNKAGLGPEPGEAASESEDEGLEEEDEGEAEDQEVEESSSASQAKESYTAAPPAGSTADLPATDIIQPDSVNGEVSTGDTADFDSAAADSLGDLRRLQKEKYEAELARRAAESEQQDGDAAHAGCKNSSPASSSVAMVAGAASAIQGSSTLPVKDERALMMEMFEQLEQGVKLDANRPTRQGFPPVVPGQQEDGPIEEPDDLPPPSRAPAASAGPDDLPPPSRVAAASNALNVLPDDLPPPSIPVAP